MNASADAMPYATSVSVFGASGSTTHTGSATLLVNLDPPGGLAAGTADGLVDLTWNASPGATSYRVARSVGGGPQTIACLAGTGYTDLGLTNGTTYRYAVTAVYTGGTAGDGTSAESAEILATPPCPVPTWAGTLGAAKSGTQDAVWSWPSGGASNYDLVEGDLDALRANAGNFQAALDALPAGENACLGSDQSASSLVDPYGAPPPGRGVFTLLRPATVECPAHGTLDEGVPSQTGSRDAEVAASPRACP
jgi:hypothetical protein